MLNEEILMEIEQSLVGSLFLNNALIVDIIESGLNEKDFMYSVHWNFLQHAQKLFLTKGSFNVADMNAVQGNFPNDIDAALYARACADSAVSSTPDQVHHYASIIRENSLKRHISSVLQETLNIIPARDSKDILSFLNQCLEDEISNNCCTKDGETVFQEILSEFERPSKFWPTGLKALDKCMAGGLYAGFTYGFAGKEKSGKTTLAHTISFNLDLIDCPHLYIALEMGSKEIERRNIARRLKTNSLSFRNPRDDFKNQVKKTQHSQNIYYLDAPGHTFSEIIQAISIARMKHGIKGFILDYWQLVEGRERSETEEQHIRFVAQRLANYAKKHGLWCIMLAQLNKDGDLIWWWRFKKGL